MLLYLLDFKKVFIEGTSKSSTAFFTVYTVQCSFFLLCALIGHLVRKCPGKIYLSVVVDVAPNLQTEPEFENV
jgi:hypothetical protein